MIESVFERQLGMPGRLLSGSKSGYSSDHPVNVVFFNANVFDCRGKKVWYGDVDLTADAQTLQTIASCLDEPFYVTRESPFRWESCMVKDLQAACQGEYPRAYLFAPRDG